MNKYEIILKYNKSEIVYAVDKDTAIFNFKEITPIQLKGKGCDSILDVKLIKQYSKEEWEDRMQKKKTSSRKMLESMFPETYKT